MFYKLNFKRNDIFRCIFIVVVLHVLFIYLFIYLFFLKFKSQMKKKIFHELKSKLKEIHANSTNCYVQYNLSMLVLRWKKKSSRAVKMILNINKIYG